MYASEQLNELAQRKELLQARIALRRMQTVVIAADLARPLALVDRGLEIWRQFSPMLKMIGLPLSFLGLRGLFRRSRTPAEGGRRRSEGKGWIGTLLGALPIVLQVYQAVTSARSAAAAGPSSVPKDSAPYVGPM